MVMLLFIEVSKQLLLKFVAWSIVFIEINQI